MTTASLSGRTVPACALAAPQASMGAALTDRVAGAAQDVWQPLQVCQGFCHRGCRTGWNISQRERLGAQAQGWGVAPSEGRAPHLTSTSGVLWRSLVHLGPWGHPRLHSIFTCFLPR